MSTGLKAFLTRDFTIDLGSSYIVVGSRRAGLLLREPAVMAVSEGATSRGKDARRPNRWTGEAALTAAREVAGVKLIRPVVQGRIAHAESLDLELEALVRQARSQFGWARLLPAVTGLLIPVGLSGDERARWRDVALRQGLSGVQLIEQPAAAAEGGGQGGDTPGGRMVVDFGGGKTCITALSMGGVVACHWSEVGSQALDEALVVHMERRHHLRITLAEAERVKIAAGSVYPTAQPRVVEVVGVQARSGNPHQVNLDDAELLDVLIDGCEPLVGALQQGFKAVPPELASDILREGVVLVGGGALLRGLPDFLEERTGLRFRVAPDPINAVMRGAMSLLQAGWREGERG